MLGVITLGVLATDLHKLILNTILFFLGKTTLLGLDGRTLDIVLVLLLFVLIVAVILSKPKEINKLDNISVLTQVLIVILLTFSLLAFHDAVSLLNYGRFLLGNFLLFISTIILCKNINDVNKLMKIFVLSSILLSIISTYMFFYGINWSSGRSNIISGVVIRSGYFSALSFIYVLSFLSIKVSLRNFGLLLVLLLLIFGVLTSGIKAPLILLLIGIAMFQIIPIILFSKIRLQIILLIPITIIIGGFIVYVTEVENAGFVKGIINFDSYFLSVSRRMDLIEGYLQIGLSKIIFGNGIGASYSLENRTHSITSAFFVQIGVVGLFFYISWLINLIYIGLRIVRKSYGFPNAQVIKHFSTVIFVMVIVLIIKGELTGDIPNNRELWFFAGLLISFRKFRIIKPNLHKIGGCYGIKNNR